MGRCGSLVASMGRERLRRTQKRRSKRTILLERLERRDLLAVVMSVPYTQDFEAGLPDGAEGWEFYSEDTGSVEVSGGRLLMHSSTNNTEWVLNEAILHVDLRELTDVRLSFDHEWGRYLGSLWKQDEYQELPSSFTGHGYGDGVSLSVNGNDWWRVSTLNGAYSSDNLTFQLDALLSNALTQAGRNADASDVRIKFQQYDDDPAPHDGRYFDDVLVDGTRPSPQALPYVEDFASGLPNAARGWGFYSEPTGSVEVNDGRLLLHSTINNEDPILNEAILHVDLRDMKDVRLSFDHEWGRYLGTVWKQDEYHELPSSFTGHGFGDGVSLSVNGSDWWRVNPLNGAYSSDNLTFQLDVLLSNAIAQAGSNADASDVRIKFQQFDDDPAPHDGRYFDDVRVDGVLHVSAGDEVQIRANPLPGPVATYLWTQLSGPDVTIVDPTSPTTSFIAPGQLADYDISLLVAVENDDFAVTSTVRIRVENGTNVTPQSANALLDAVTYGGQESVSTQAFYSSTPLFADAPLIPVDLSRSYRLSGDARSGDGNGNLYNPNNRQYFGLRMYDANQNSLGDNYVGIANAPVLDIWTVHETVFNGSILNPATAFVQVIVLPNNHSGNANLITWRDVEFDYANSEPFRSGDSIDLHVNAVALPGVTYQWVQIDGPALQISDATSPTAKVTAVPWIEDYAAKFEVRISDGELTTKRTVEFNVDVGTVFAIDDIDVVEGNSGTTNAIFTVYLTEPITSGSATVYYVTYLTNGLASDGSDFTGSNIANIPITFAPGETQKSINIPVLGDTTGEFDETFYVDLVHPVGAAIGKAKGMATIIDDDTSPLDLNLNLTAPSGVGSGIKDAGFVQSLSYFPSYLPTYYGDATLNTAQLIGLTLEFPANVAVPSSLNLQTKLGTEISVPQNFDASGFSAGDSVSLTALAKVDEFATGLYPLDVLITAQYANGTLGTRKLSDTVIINNLQNSEFGSRRNLSFLDRLYVHDPGNGSPAGVAVVRGNNSASWFESNGDGTFQRPPAVFSTLVQNGNGSYTLTNKFGNRDEFNSGGILTSRVDRNGNVTSYGYIDADADGKSDELASVTDAFGRSITYAYANGLLATVTDFAGRVTTFQYAGNLLLKVTYPDPDGTGAQLAPVEHFAYGAEDRLERVIDPANRVSTISYDSVTGRYSSLQRADQSQWDLQSVQSGSVTELVMTGAVGGMSTDAGTHGVRNETSYKTDDFGNIIERTDALGNTYVYDRDADGLTLRFEQPDPDDAGPLGILETFYDYDDRGNLELLTLPDQATRSWEYDPVFSQVTKSTDELGRVTDYEIDPANGNTTTQTLRATNVRLAGDPLNPWQNNVDRFDVNNDGIVSWGDLTTLQLDIDLNGERTLPATVPANAPVHYVDVDGDGSVDTAFDVAALAGYLNGTASIDSVSIYTYTDGVNVPNVPKGLPRTSKDGLGRVTRYDYETDVNSHAFGWLKKTTYAVGTAEEAFVEYEYDTAGNQTAVIDEIGRRTEFVYDKLNRLVEVVEADPDGAGPLTSPVSSFAYDAVSNLTSSTDAKGFVTSYTYDEVNRVKTVTSPIPQGSDPADALVTEYFYDGNGNLEQVIDPLGRETDYVYDALNRLETVTGPDPGTGQHGRPTVTTVYDNVGNVQSVTDPLQNVTSFVYDERHRLIERTDPLPHPASPPVVSTFEYDGASQLKARSVGVLDNWTYQSGSGQVTVNWAGYEWSYEYDDFGQLTQETAPKAGWGLPGYPVTHYEYDAVGNLTAVVDPSNNVTAFAHDARNRVFKQTDPALGDARLVASEVIGAMDPANLQFRVDQNDNDSWDTGDATKTLFATLYPNTTRLPLTGDWNDDGIGDFGVYYGINHANTTAAFSLAVREGAAATCSSSAGCPAESNEFTVLGNPQTDRPIVGDWQVAGPRGRDRIGYHRDVGANAQFYLNFGSGGQTFTFGASGGVPVIGDWNGDGIDDVGLWFDSTNTFVLDADGSRSASAGDLTFTYLAPGTQPIAGDWNGDGIDEVGLFNDGTVYLDTNADRIWNTGDETRYFPNSGEIPFVIQRGAFYTEGTFEEAIETEFIFDDANQLQQLIDPLGRITTYEYDGLGRSTKVTSPDPDGAGPELAPFTTFTYDPVGNLTGRTDALGHSMSYGYDRLHRRVSETDANGDITAFGFDKVGNLKTLTDPAQNTTTWLYDDLNRVITETNQLGKSRQYQYDAVGNLTKLTDRNGRITDYVYDDLYRLDQEIWRNGSGGAIRTIDMDYNHTGQLVTAKDSSGSAVLSQYDFWYSSSLGLTSLGAILPLSTLFSYSSLTTGLSASYDAVGNRTALTASGGGDLVFQNRYAYDNLYRMTSVTQSFVPDNVNPSVPETGALPVAAKRVDFTYDKASQLSQIIRYEDLDATKLVATSTFAFDLAGRLTDLTHQRNATVFADYDWDFDAGNRLEQFVSLVDGTADYNYDARDQLTGADYTGTGLPADESYTYDDNGNRVLANGASYQTTANNRLANDGTYTYLYDDEGNLTKRTKTSNGSYTVYTWDHRNRLSQITDKTSSHVVTKDVYYKYDVFDRRIAKAVIESGQTTQNDVYIYDGAHIAMTLSYNATSQEYELTNRYLHGPAVDMILADEQISDPAQAGNTLWPLTDNLGSVRDLADYNAATDTTTIANHLVYDSFGNIASETNAAIDHIFGYTGRERDEESAWYFYRGRYYDPRTARFASEDPIGFAAGDPNLHRYVGNNATGAIDPYGLQTGPIREGSHVLDATGTPTGNYCGGGGPGVYAEDCGTGAMDPSSDSSDGLNVGYWSNVGATAKGYFWNGPWRIESAINPAKGIYRAPGVIRGYVDSIVLAFTNPAELKRQEDAKWAAIRQWLSTPEGQGEAAFHIATIATVGGLTGPKTGGTVPSRAPVGVAGALGNPGSMATIPGKTPGGLGYPGSMATLPSRAPGGLGHPGSMATALVREPPAHPTFGQGPFAGQSIPARSTSQVFTAAERQQINSIGQSTGCHTCGTTTAGTKSGNFVPDHQPPSALMTPGQPQQLYPQCINCSREQGLAIARQKRGG